jgi:hypothetical protein
LAALDDQCVPLNLLTTVSGGTIVGASYALGVPPVEFAHRLASGRPGLPGERIRLWAAVSDLFLSRSTTDTYADRFRRAFFGAATLAEMPDVPILVANVTDFEADALRAREIIFKARAVEVHVKDKPLGLFVA